MFFDRSRAGYILHGKLLMAAGLLVLAGCQAATNVAGTDLFGPDGQIQTFIVDFARQALAALVL